MNSELRGEKNIKKRQRDRNKNEEPGFGSVSIPLSIYIFWKQFILLARSRLLFLYKYIKKKNQSRNVMNIREGGGGVGEKKRRKGFDYFCFALQTAGDYICHGGPMLRG